MILFDQETTAVIRNSVIPKEQQPEILEFAALKLDKNLKAIKRISFLVKPRIMPISPEITKITGITTELVENERPFAAYFPDVVDFFMGERTLVAHNLPFDRDILTFELRRLGKEFAFPYPPQQICTAEMSIALFGKRLKLSELRALAPVVARVQTHRAMDDVLDLADVVRFLRKEHAAI